MSPWRWCVPAVLLAGSSGMMSGCESCSFTFGHREMTALVYLPAGYEDANIEVDGLGRQTGSGALGIYSVSWSEGSQSDGPRKCEFPAGAIEVSHPRCETQRVTYEATPSTHETSGLLPQIEIFMSCEPSSVPGRPGWWCQQDEDCGGEDFTCLADVDVCVPPQCAESVDCGDETRVTCDASTQTCIAPE